jgi:hypothetical protein
VDDEDADQEEALDEDDENASVPEETTAR